MKHVSENMIRSQMINIAEECSLIHHFADIFHIFFFSHAYVGQDYSIQKNVGKISLEQIDSVSFIESAFEMSNPRCYCILLRKVG